MTQEPCEACEAHQPRTNHERAVLAAYEEGRRAERQRIRQALAIRLRDVVDPSAYADLLDGAS